MSLNKTQIGYLKKLGHALKPVVIVGQHGLTEGVFNEIDLSLETHELLKVRLNAGDRDERQSMVTLICDKTHSELVQRIGHVAVLFRRNADNPKIALPKG